MTNYYKSCRACGFETECDHIKFHKMEMNKLDEKGNRMECEICDICANVFGAYTEIHSSTEQPIRYSTLIQAFHWLYDNLRDKK